MFLKLDPASRFQAIYAHQAQASAVDVKRLEIQIVHADEFQALIGQRDEFLPLNFSVPSFGDVRDGTEDIAPFVGRNRI